MKILHYKLSIWTNLQAYGDRISKVYPIRFRIALEGKETKKPYIFQGWNEFGCLVKTFVERKPLLVSMLTEASKLLSVKQEAHELIRG
jgi:hypothetical protein